MSSHIQDEKVWVCAGVGACVGACVGLNVDYVVQLCSYIVRTSKCKHEHNVL